MKDEESAFQILCHFLQTYNYREIYSKDLATLQVGVLQCIPSISCPTILTAFMNLWTRLQYVCE